MTQLSQTPFRRDKKKNSITFEVIRHITLYYFTVAIFLTLAQIVLEYFQIKRNIEHQVQDIIAGTYESLTNSLWEFNSVQTEAIIQGIGKNPAILYVSVRNAEGQQIYTSGNGLPMKQPRLPVFDPNTVFLFQKPLIKQVDEHDLQRIGELSIYSGNIIIFELLSHIVFTIFINSILKTFFLWCILLIFFKNKLKNPLDEFVQSISNINPQNPANVDLKISKHILEFSRIENAFNNLVQQVRNYKDVLEAIVENKTELLKEKNEEVTELIQKLSEAQKRILQQEKLTSLGILSAGIAHELKNPLNLSKNTVLMIEDIVKERDDLPRDFQESAEQFIKIARDSNERMQHIITNMLIQARIENTDFVSIGLREFIETNYNVWVKSIGDKVNPIVFENRVSNDLVLEVQANDFGRLLLNLFQNATHSIMDKARESDESFQGIIRVSAGEPDESGMASIEFWDNGKGVPQKIIDNIMEPFFTTKPAGSGTGLGLYLTYKIVEQHNGKITVKSEEGEFACFVVTIPIKQHKQEDGAP